MKNKPSWAFWLLWVVFYTIIDMIIARVWDGVFAWNQVQGAVEGALFGATVTWLFALYKWHKADCGI
jgi:hypothetical protein